MQDIRQTYETGAVVRLAGFCARRGESWLLLGPSGSGKSTLLHLLGGLQRPTAGRVEVAGQDLSRLSGASLDRFRGRHIGIVFQQLHLIPTLTVESNLRIANYMAGKPQDPRRIRETLDALGIGERRDAYPDELSLGQQQRAAIARAVINEPCLILADEPTSALDDTHADTVIGLLIEQAASRDATLVVATHDRRIVTRISKRIALGDQTTTEPEVVTP